MGLTDHIPAEARTIETLVPLHSKERLACRLFGHKWKPAHRLDESKQGLPIWVYTDDVCTRCWKTEWRMPR